tara:strand:+ start:319 stop:591 length:273 start_codon:yes stop_codon:yes gene_type:complete
VSKQFKEKIYLYGQYTCETNKKQGKGHLKRCDNDNHTCEFILTNRIRRQIHKIPPRFSTWEQRRMRAYSSQAGEGYFKKYEVNKLRKPPK